MLEAFVILGGVVIVLLAAGLIAAAKMSAARGSRPPPAGASGARSGREAPSVGTCSSASRGADGCARQSLPAWTSFSASSRGLVKTAS